MTTPDPFTDPALCAARADMRNPGAHPALRTRAARILLASPALADRFEATRVWQHLTGEVQAISPRPASAVGDSGAWRPAT